MKHGYLLRAAMMTGLLSMLTGAVALVRMLVFEPTPMLYISYATIMIVAGVALFMTCNHLEDAEGKIQKLQAERKMLTASYNTQREMYHGLSRRAEELSLVSEIHLSTNIVSRGERLRQLLTTLAQLSERVEVTMFALSDAKSIQSGMGHLRPVAYLLSRPSNKLFIRFDRDFKNATELNVHEGVLSSSVKKNVLSGNIMSDNEKIGHIEAVGTNALTGQPDYVLTELLRNIDLNTQEAENTIELRSPSRAQDTDRGISELIYPLATGGDYIGALRLRTLEQAAGTDSLSQMDIESLIRKSIDHIALALKKETDGERATLDALTGLYSRGEFDRKSVQLFNESRETAQPLGYLFIDIDKFKGVNDDYGHKAGDMILRGVAGRIRSLIRKVDAAYRYGGEELCVLMPGANLDAAKMLAERLRSSVEKATFRTDSDEISVTISIGLAVLDASKDDLPMNAGPTSYIERADKAVYAAKEGGRNQVVVWSKELDECATQDKPKLRAVRGGKKKAKKKAKTRRKKAA